MVYVNYTFRRSCGAMMTRTIKRRKWRASAVEFAGVFEARARRATSADGGFCSASARHAISHSQLDARNICNGRSTFSVSFMERRSPAQAATRPVRRVGPGEWNGVGHQTTTHLCGDASVPLNPMLHFLSNVPTFSTMAVLQGLCYVDRRLLHAGTAGKRAFAARRAPCCAGGAACAASARTMMTS